MSQDEGSNLVTHERFFSIEALERLRSRLAQNQVTGGLALLYILVSSLIGLFLFFSGSMYQESGRLTTVHWYALFGIWAIVTSLYALAHSNLTRPASFIFGLLLATGFVLLAVPIFLDFISSLQ